MAESVAAVTTVVDRHKVCRVGYGSARAPGGGRMRRAGGLAAVTPHRCHRRHPHPPACAVTDRAPISEARFGILDELPILEVSIFPSAKYYPIQSCPLVNTSNIHIYGIGMILSGRSHIYS